MYEKIYITESHLRVLSLFTKGYEESYYIREVGRMLAISPRTAQLILQDLEKRGILESRTRGKIRIFYLRKNDRAKDYLILVEHYKRISFLKEKPLIQEITGKIRQHITGLCVIFGSYAKGTQTKDSDLDILVIGNYSGNAVRKISELYGIDVSIKRYPPEFFRKNIRTDILLREVVKDHIILGGVEEFVVAALQ